MVVGGYGKLKTFMFIYFFHLFVCKLWSLFAFNFDNTYLLLVGCISSGVAGFVKML
jgi:hypothetical protein